MCVLYELVFCHPLKMCDLIKQRFIMDIIIAHTNYLK